MDRKSLLVQRFTLCVSAIIALEINVPDISNADNVLVWTGLVALLSSWWVWRTLDSAIPVDLYPITATAILGFILFSRVQSTHVLRLCLASFPVVTAISFQDMSAVGTNCVSAVSCFFLLLSLQSLSPFAVKEALGSLIYTVVCCVYSHSIIQQRLKEDGPETDVQSDTTANSKDSAVNLIANVSHDMRTPLAALESGCETLETSMDTLRMLSVNGEVKCMKDTVRTIRSTCVIMHSMINRYTDFAKLNSDLALHPNCIPFHIEDCVRECVQHVASVQQRVPVDVVWTQPPCCGVISSDRGWIFESLLCLVNNAVRYSDLEAKVVLRLSVQCRRPIPVASCPRSCPCEVRIEVENYGEGLSVEVQETLFEPLGIKTRAASGGTGLGLYTMYHRMKALGGECGFMQKEDDRVHEVVDDTDLLMEKGDKVKTLFWFSFPTEASILPSDTLPCSRSCSADDGSAPKSLPPLIIPSALPDTQPSATHVSWSESESATESYNDSKRSGQALNEVSSPVSPVSYSSFATPLHSTRPTHRALKVLLVDDSLAILKMTHKLLEKDGYQVTSAVDGQHALQILEKDHGFDVCIMDIQMPVLDGIETTRLYRELEQAENDRVRFIDSRPDMEKTVSDYDLRKVEVSWQTPADGRSAGESVSDLSVLTEATLASMSWMSSKTPRRERALTIDDRRSSLSQFLFTEAERVKHLPIIGCSATSDDEIIQAALNAGMDAFIPKPISLQKLHDTLRAIGVDVL